MRRRILAMLTAIALITVSMTGCVNNVEQANGEYVKLLPQNADAEWVPYVLIKVKNNKVFQVTFDAVSRIDGVSTRFKKSTEENDGWAKSIGEVDKYILLAQKPEKINVDDNGRIIGTGAPQIDLDVSYYVKTAKELLQANKVTPRGKYRDGIKNQISEKFFKKTKLKLACDANVTSGYLLGINFYFVDENGQKVEDFKGPAKKLANRFDEIEFDLVSTQDATKYAETDKELNELLNGVPNPENPVLMLTKGVLLS